MSIVQWLLLILLIAVVGGASAQTMPDGPLQPGDALGVSLIRGDLSMAATGTVTLVEDGRVHAFGHPFYSLGPARFPMTRAFVHTVLPSQAISSKIALVYFGEVLSGPIRTASNFESLDMRAS